MSQSDQPKKPTEIGSYTPKKMDILNDVVKPVLGIEDKNKPQRPSVSSREARPSGLALIHENALRLQEFDLSMDEDDAPLADAIDDVIALLSESLFELEKEIRAIKESRTKGSNE